MCSNTDLTIGKVFLLFDSQSIPPKHKRCIIVGFTEDKSQFATVFINTGVNMHFINSSDLEALQVEIIPGDDRKYIDHPSFIDCSELKHRFPTSFIEDVRNSGKILGSLSQQDFKAVLDCIRNADSIPTYFKGLYNLNNTD